jgi:heme exporter protein D
VRNLDFSSWQAVLTTLLGLAVITLIGVGVRLLLMQTVQQRRERENRQINERLRTLIAAYKTLGGSFTGDLAVSPIHLRDLAESERLGSDRPRRIRDAVEAALSDIILLGTEEQVRLAAQAATELSAGRPVHTADLVISLRDFIRGVLDLEPVPVGLAIPKQGPARPSASRGGGKGDGGDARGEKSGGGKNAGDGAMGGGLGMGLGMGVGTGAGAGIGAGIGSSVDDPNEDDSAR